MSESSQRFFRAMGEENISIIPRDRMVGRFMAVICGDADIYLEPRRLPWWDIAPYFAAIRAQGGSVASLLTTESAACFGASLRAPPFIMARQGVRVSDILNRIPKN